MSRRITMLQKKVETQEAKEILEIAKLMITNGVLYDYIKDNIDYLEYDIDRSKYESAYEYYENENYHSVNKMIEIAFSQEK